MKPSRVKIGRSVGPRAPSTPCGQPPEVGARVPRWRDLSFTIHRSPIQARRAASAHRTLLGRTTRQTGTRMRSTMSRMIASAAPNSPA